MDKLFDSAKGTVGSLFYGLIAIAMLTLLMGGSNTAAGAAFVIVIGAEIILRRLKKKAAKFGEVARGSEVEDHTK
jgi:hypothetical protein